VNVRVAGVNWIKLGSSVAPSFIVAVYTKL
jgi:hypothetical protein